MQSDDKDNGNPVTTQADRWRTLQRKAELYKRTRDPKLREEVAGLMWIMMVSEGQIIARKHLPFRHDQQPREVSEDVTASLLGKGMTVLLEKHKSDGKAGLRTYLARAINNKLIDYARKEKWHASAPHSDAATSSTGDEADSQDDVLGRGRPDSIESELELPELGRIARTILDVDRELPVLNSFLWGYTRKEGAAELGITESLYKSRLEGAIAKLARYYNDAIDVEPDYDVVD